MQIQKSLFITLEGGEGAGKSTLLANIKSALEAIGHNIITSREPGGTKGAEQIRELLVNGDVGRWNKISELCLFYAAREDHLERVIRPALAENKFVICDRFFDSTRAYQGDLSQDEAKLLKNLEEIIVGNTIPNITFILDIDVKTGLMRANKRNGDVNNNNKEGRFEAMKIEFHENLRKAFLNIAKNEPERCFVLDATKSPEDLLSDAMQIISQKLGEQNG